MPSKTHSYPEYATKIGKSVRITKHPPDKSPCRLQAATKKQPLQDCFQHHNIGRLGIPNTLVSIFLFVEELVYTCLSAIYYKIYIV